MIQRAIKTLRGIVNKIIDNNSRDRFIDSTMYNTINNNPDIVYKFYGINKKKEKKNIMIKTPKEKAIELVKKFDCGGLQTFAGHDVKKIAKECALITVKEIKKTVYFDELEYWEEVEEEITNIE